MKLTSREIEGVNCNIIWSADTAPVSVSIYAADNNSSALPVYGALAYSVPTTNEQVSTTILVPSNNHDFRNSCQTLSYLVAKRVSRPVFVNSSVHDANVRVFGAVCDVIDELLK